MLTKIPTSNEHCKRQSPSGCLRLYLVVALAFVVAIFWTSVVYAEGGVPEVPQPLESEVVVEEAPVVDVETQEVGVSEPEVEAVPDEAAPVEEEVVPASETDSAPEEISVPDCDIDEDTGECPDADGDPQPEEGEPTSDEIPAVEPSTLNIQPPGVPDPYFFVDGEKHSYLPTGGDCRGAVNCAVSTTPIQDALNAVTGGLAPDDGTIYIEGGEFDEFVHLNNFAGELTLQGSANGSETILTGGVSLSNLDGNVRLHNFSFEAGVSAINTNGLTITESNFDAGLVVLNSQDVELENTKHDAGVVISGSDNVNVTGSTFDAGVIISGSGDVTLTDTQVNAALVVVASDVSVVGSEEDDHVEAELEDDASTLAVSGGGGKDRLSVKLNAGQASLAAQKVTAGTSLVQYDESVESLSVEAVETEVEIIEEVALLGELDVVAEAITISDNLTAERIELIAAAELTQAADTQVAAMQSVAYTAETIFIAGELRSDGDIELNAEDGIKLEEGATISVAGNLIINADTDGDGLGIFEQVPGAVIEAQWGDVNIVAADVEIEDEISAPAGDVGLRASTPDAVILLGDTGIDFELSNAELANLNPGVSLTIGDAAHTRQVLIGQLEIQSAGFALNIFGGEIGLGEISLAFGMVLNLVALGGVFDRNGKGRNITMPGGALFMQARTVGAADDPIETAVDMLAAQVGVVGGAFVSDLNHTDPPQGMGVYIVNEGDLTLGGAGMAVDGEIFVSTSGSFEFAAPLTASGAVNLMDGTGGNDPYFTRDGTKYTYLPTGSNCLGDPNCTITATPIQDAIQNVKDNGMPDDDTIYIEDGTYAEDITIDGFDADLVLEGGAGGGTTILSGVILISNNGTAATRTLTLRDVAISNVLAASCASSTTAGLSIVLDQVDLQTATLGFTGTANADSVVINLSGASGTNTIVVDGVGGTDSFAISDASGAVEFAANGTTLTGAAWTVTHTNVETLELSGGDGDDTFSVTTWANMNLTVDGADGADRLVLPVENAAGDTININANSVAVQGGTWTAGHANIESLELSSGAGDDTFSVTLWENMGLMLDGGAGDDTITLSGASDAYSLALSGIETYASVSDVTDLSADERDEIIQGLSDFADWAADLGAAVDTLLTNNIPYLGSSFADLLDFAAAVNAFKAEVETQLTASTTPPILDIEDAIELAAALEGWTVSTGGADFAASQVYGQIVVSGGQLIEQQLLFHLTNTKTQNANLDINSENADGMGEISMRTNTPPVPVTAAVEMGLGVGVEVGTDPEYFATQQATQATAEVSATGLTPSFLVGFTGGTVVDGWFNLNAEVDIAITDAGADGKLLGAELTEATNTITGSGTAAGDFTATSSGIPIVGTPEFAVASSDIFAADPGSFTPNSDFEDTFKPFSVMQATDVVRMFASFSDWLMQVGLSEAFGTPIPFAAETLLRDMFSDYSRLAALFEEKITNYLAPTELKADAALAAGEYAPGGDVVFTLLLDGIEYTVTVSGGASAGNTNVDDVAADLSAAVDVAIGAGQITVSHADGVLVFTSGQDSGIGELRIKAEGESLAVT
ncbi:MAG: hypothetical protein H8D34_02325, partial [Chloroflexi bacterium]|nr:hypothetical protein [Chloroflexota bacterium]